MATKKDACYNKVKSRYKVWPSAYASGALVKCRKVGAKNWGNKSRQKKKTGVTKADKKNLAVEKLPLLNPKVLKTCFQAKEQKLN
jgi:hypothetical protein